MGSIDGGTRDRRTDADCRSAILRILSCHSVAINLTNPIYLCPIYRHLALGGNWLSTSVGGAILGGNVMGNHRRLPATAMAALAQCFGSAPARERPTRPDRVVAVGG